MDCSQLASIFFKWQGQGVSFRSQEVMGQLGWQWTRWVTWWHGIHQPGFPGQMNQSDMIFRVINMVGWKITMILIWCSQLETGIFLGDSSNLLQWFPHFSAGISCSWAQDQWSAPKVLELKAREWLFLGGLTSAISWWLTIAQPDKFPWLCLNILEKNMKNQLWWL